MHTDDSLIPSINKSELTHALEGLVCYADQVDDGQTDDTYKKDTYLIIDTCNHGSNTLRNMQCIRWLTNSLTKLLSYARNQLQQPLAPPTACALYQHLFRAHLQDILWAQDVAVEPTIPDPFKMVDLVKQMTYLLQYYQLVSLHLKLVNCGSGIINYSRRCMCTQH